MTAIDLCRRALVRNEWNYGPGQCAVCYGLAPGDRWQWWDATHASGARKRRCKPHHLGHAPDCPRALLLIDLGIEPLFRSANPFEDDSLRLVLK